MSIIEPDDVVIEILTHAHRVRAHEIVLQVCQFVVADAYLRQLSEARIDAIYLVAVRNHVIDEFL